MTNNEVWQQMLSLESRDVTTQWFAQIHSRELNARRAKEINAAAKQAREYFRNAGEAAYSIRPLLTFTRAGKGPWLNHASTVRA